MFKTDSYPMRLQTQQFLVLLVILAFSACYQGKTDPKYSSDIEEWQKPYHLTCGVVDDHKDYPIGYSLYKVNCAVCHSIDHKVIVGRGLAGAKNRIPSKQWFFDYLSDSDSMLQAKDPYALFCDSIGNHKKMTHFKHLKSEEMEQLYKFVISL